MHSPNVTPSDGTCHNVAARRAGGPAPRFSTQRDDSESLPADTVPLADQGMKLGLRALNGFASLDLLDRIGLRQRAEKLVFGASKHTSRTAARANRAFSGVARRAQPVRLETARSSGLFDLTPTDEQDMLRESFASFAAERLRPAAERADADCAAPADLLAQSAGLGITMVGVPEELGGVFSERSSTTSVLIAETLAHGDMSLAFAALAPAAVSTALALWGDAD